MLTLYQKPVESIICLAIIALGIPVFWLGVKWEKPKSVQKKLGLFVFFVVDFV